MLDSVRLPAPVMPACLAGIQNDLNLSIALHFYHMCFIEDRSGCQLKACWHDRNGAYPELRLKNITTRLFSSIKHLSMTNILID